MRAIVQDSYGSAEVLRPAEITRPEIADDEVLVRVHAAGLDRGTWHLMTGTPYLMRVIGFGLRRPKNRVPGVDVAGTVVAVGAAVTRFAVPIVAAGAPKPRPVRHPLLCAASESPRVRATTHARPGKPRGGTAAG